MKITAIRWGTGGLFKGPFVVDKVECDKDIPIENGDGVEVSRIMIAEGTKIDFEPITDNPTKDFEEKMNALGWFRK